VNIRLEDEQTSVTIVAVVADIDKGRTVEVGRQAMKAILSLGYGAGWSRVDGTLTVSVLAPLRQGGKRLPPGERWAIDWMRVAVALRQVSGVVGAPVVRQLGDAAWLKVAS